MQCKSYVMFTLQHHILFAYKTGKTSKNCMQKYPFFLKNTIFLAKKMNFLRFFLVYIEKTPTFVLSF